MSDKKEVCISFEDEQFYTAYCIAKTAEYNHRYRIMREDIRRIDDKPVLRRQSASHDLQKVFSMK